MEGDYRSYNVRGPRPVRQSDPRSRSPETHTHSRSRTPDPREDPDPREHADPGDTLFNRQDIFDEFIKLIRSNDKNVITALQNMFPIATKDYKNFETLLYKFLRTPAAETDVDMETQKLDEGDVTESSMVTENPDRTINKSHASDFKAYVSKLFKKGSIPEGGVNVDKFFSDNFTWFNAIKAGELRYSEEMAEGARELITEDLQQVNIINPAPQSKWVDLELGGLQPLPIKVDAETAAYLRTVTIDTIKRQYLRVFQSLTEIITRIGYITIKLGSFTFNVSAHTLLWLLTFFYDLLKGKLAKVFGPRINSLLEYFYASKEKLFGSPFMNILPSTVEESKIRRLNRIVNIFLYTMIDLLIRVKKREILLDTPGLEGLEGLEGFIGRDINTWLLKEIYNYGSILFNRIMAPVGISKIREYHEWYEMSIQKVAYFVDYRIFSARLLGEHTLNSVLSPLAIVMTARPIRQREQSEIEEVMKAEQKLKELNIPIPGYSGLEPEPESEPGAQSKKKKTRRRRKSKGNISTKGKKKKGKKRKQTKRGRKKK